MTVFWLFISAAAWLQTVLSLSDFLRTAAPGNEEVANITPSVAASSQVIEPHERRFTDHGDRTSLFATSMRAASAASAHSRRQGQRFLRKADPAQGQGKGFGRNIAPDSQRRRALLALHDRRLLQPDTPRSMRADDDEAAASSSDTAAMSTASFLSDQLAEFLTQPHTFMLTASHSVPPQALRSALHVAKIIEQLGRTSSANQTDSDATPATVPLSGFSSDLAARIPDLFLANVYVEPSPILKTVFPGSDNGTTATAGQVDDDVGIGVDRQRTTAVQDASSKSSVDAEMLLLHRLIRLTSLNEHLEVFTGRQPLGPLQPAEKALLWGMAERVSAGLRDRPRRGGELGGGAGMACCIARLFVLHVSCRFQSRATQPTECTIGLVSVSGPRRTPWWSPGVA